MSMYRCSISGARRMSCSALSCIPVVMMAGPLLVTQGMPAGARVARPARRAQHASIHHAPAPRPVAQHSRTPTPIPEEIAKDTTLTVERSPYVVHDSITVDNKAILTIQPGVVIKFDQGTNMQIGGDEGSPGFLLAKGVRTNANGASIPTPIHFLASLPNPTHGYWNGIVFNNSQYRSIMDYCDVSNAGAGGTAAIQVNNGNAPTITNCSITWGDGDGVAADNGNFTAFDGNTIAHFKGSGMNISCEAAGAVGPNNHLIANGHDYIHLNHGIHHDAHWTNNTVPFFADNGIAVESASDGKDAMLTLDPGVHIIFGHAQKLLLGWSNTGSLTAVGTTTKPIVLSGDPDWAGIDAPKAKQLDLNNCVIEDVAANARAIHASTGQISLINTTISSGQVGISTSGHATFSAFHGNTITGMKEVPVELDARQVAGLEVDNKLTGNGQDVVRINGSNVDADAEWQALPVPYLADNGIQVEAPAEGDDVTLTLDAGVLIRFADDQQVTLGWSNTGSLKAVGTAEKPIVLTSADKDPEKGDWKGINFEKSGSETDLEGVRIEYAGTKDGGAALQGGGRSRGKITDCTIAHSGNGMDLQNTKVKVSGLKFEDVDSGTTAQPQ